MALGGEKRVEREMVAACWGGWRGEDLLVKGCGGEGRVDGECRGGLRRGGGRGFGGAVTSSSEAGDEVEHREGSVCLWNCSCHDDLLSVRFYLFTRERRP